MFYSRQRRDAGGNSGVNSSAGGLTPNQSLERMRWAPAVRFAGRPWWRAPQLQIRDAT